MEGVNGVKNYSMILQQLSTCRNQVQPAYSSWFMAIQTGRLCDGNNLQWLHWEIKAKLHTSILKHLHTCRVAATSSLSQPGKWSELEFSYLSSWNKHHHSPNCIIAWSVAQSGTVSKSVAGSNRCQIGVQHLRQSWDRVETELRQLSLESKESKEHDPKASQLSSNLTVWLQKPDLQRLRLRVLESLVWGALQYGQSHRSCNILQHLATSCNCSASVQQHENSAFVPFKLPETPADKFAILGQFHKKVSQRCFKGPEQNIGFCVSWSLRSLKCEVKIFRSLKWSQGVTTESLPWHRHDTWRKWGLSASQLCAQTSAHQSSIGRRMTRTTQAKSALHFLQTAPAMDSSMAKLLGYMRYYIYKNHIYITILDII